MWLLIELAGYFGMAQFPAVRRVMGLTLVSTIIVARLAAVRSRRGGRWAVWAAVAPGIALGLFYESVDISDSRVEPEAARQAAAFIRNEDSQATVWFTGHWGFQYEAIKQGMKPVVPGRSLLQAGDWLVAPEPWLRSKSSAQRRRRGVGPCGASLGNSRSGRCPPTTAGGCRWTPGGRRGWRWAYFASTRHGCRSRSRLRLAPAQAASGPGITAASGTRRPARRSPAHTGLPSLSRGWLQRYLLDTFFRLRVPLV